ncbi:M23 family metallopeptidase [Oceanimonas sp. MB9]|uniref:peptidoglycan DD-metalloendopeptidase family protein n=1 Tax=Oceanimonas sp. MB9 TaxID=2588453 RepID=UPI0013F5F38E|nr:M23 family metallopeptidase [Oceanimonas sp. MB9]NHH99646.1 Glycyl-glycine endopeptidase ALE-1 [Oceanimonas sp. MB9]
MRGLLACWLALAWMTSAQAEIYRYRDAAGVVHYTDNRLKAVSGHRWHQDAVNKDGILVRVVKKPDGHYFFALNRLASRAQLNLQFSSQQNVVIPAALQQAVVLPAREEKFLGKLIPSGPGAWGYDYGFAYSSHQGRNQVDSDHRVQKIAGSTIVSPRVKAWKEYRNQAAPVVVGAVNMSPPVSGTFRISQGFNGDFSHNKASNRYALDIALPVGTPLLATADGVVVAAVDHHVGGGLAARYRGKSNHLRLRHNDGTMTLYAHLDTHSLTVKKGDRVRAGQVVAASGHTGYSSGPHLHLAVQVNNKGRLESIPFTLNGRVPATGQTLLARGSEGRQ